MKRIIIIAVVVLSSAITAFALSGSEKKDTATIKFNKTDFAAKGISAPKSDLASAD
jgi:hypothetical protein